MNETKILQAYNLAAERYAELGIDTEAVLAAMQRFSLSLHCW